MLRRTWKWLILALHGAASIMTLIFIVIVIITPGTFPILLIIALFLEIVAIWLEWLELARFAQFARKPQKWFNKKMRKIKKKWLVQFYRTSIGGKMLAKINNFIDTLL